MTKQKPMTIRRNMRWPFFELRRLSNRLAFRRGGNVSTQTNKPRWSEAYSELCLIYVPLMGVVKALAHCSSQWKKRRIT